MTTIDNGGPAFPFAHEENPEPSHPIGTRAIRVFQGMTLRDYFAAQSLTGAQIWDAVLNGKNAHFQGGVEQLAEVAYAVADAMLKARNDG